MSTPVEASDLDRLAEAIADAQPVRWPAPGSVTTEDLARRLEGLRQIEHVASAYRDLHRRQSGDEDAPRRVPRGTPLFRWGGLEVLERLGEGSFGEVYRAFDPKLDREVALKLRREDRPGRRDLVAEARRLARVHHPNVVAVHGVDEHDGRIGLWTDLVDGVTLCDQVRNQGPLGPREAVSIALDLCGALAAIHGVGLVHGDVKPSNVMRERGGRIVLMDFGSGTEMGPDGLHAASPAFGTPAVMPPELLAGEPASPGTDLYSLGAVLYFLVTGHFPIEAASLAELMDKAGRGESVAVSDLRPDLPAALVAVIERATATDPAHRYPTAGALRSALAELMAADPEASARRTLTSEDDRRLPRPALWPLAALLVGAIAVAILVAPRLPGVRARRDAAAGPAAPTFVSTKPTLTATLFRDEDDSARALADGDTVRPGDRLFLEVRADEPVHLYVLNEDREGHVFALFPLPGLDLANPLSAGRRHRVPGAVGGQAQDWVVTSAGGEERFMVLAARRALPGLEGAIGKLEAADAARAVDLGALASEHGVTLRGVGGLATGTQRSSRLAQLREELPGLAGDEPVWVDEVVLANPAR